MIIVAGGDSFTFGAELKDQRHHTYSMSSFPAILSQGFEYRCAAWPGNSNSAIARMTIEACNSLKKENKLFGVIITWSFVNRYEFRFNYNTGHRISPWHTINSWTTQDDISVIAKEFRNKNRFVLTNQTENIIIGKMTGTAEFAKVWFKHVGDSEYYELYSSLKEILFLQYYLEKNNIPYLFVPADNCFYDHPNFTRQKDSHLEVLYNQIDWTKWFFFDKGENFDETKAPRGFYQWAVENKYPIGATHPLEEAHLAAAQLIKEKFNELVTKPLEQSQIRNTI